jgi:hypothetical protein
LLFSRLAIARLSQGEYDLRWTSSAKSVGARSATSIAPVTDFRKVG